MEKKIALQLKAFKGDDFKELIKTAASAGFKYFSIGLTDINPLLDSDWKDYIIDIKKTLDENGLKCIQTHAPYYNLLISAEVSDSDIDLATIRSIEATKMLGADLIAVHPRSFIIPDMPRETAVDRKMSLEENIKSFIPLVKEGEKLGVLIGIENLMKYPTQYPYFYSWIVDDQIELIDSLNSKNACAIWDFGHANLIKEDNHADRIEKLGSRIKGTHVHNNDGREDMHLPPFLPPKDYYTRCSVDWNSTLSALSKTGYDGYLTLEVVYNVEHCLKEYFEYSYHSVSKLYEILKG